MNVVRILSFIIALLGLSVASESVFAGAEPVQQRWEYHWGDVDPNNFPLDEEWTSFTPDKHPPGRNSQNIVWYRFRIPEQLAPDSHIFIPGVYQLYQVYHRQQKLLNFGNFSAEAPEKLLGQKFHMIPLPQKAGGEWLYFRIFSEFGNIGFNGIPAFGNEYGLLRHIVQKDLFRAVAAFLFIFIGLFQFFLFRNRSSFREHMAFGSFIILFGIHTFARTNLKQILLDLPVFWKYAEIVTVLFLPIGLCLFIESAFSAGYKNCVRYLRYFGTAIASGVTVLGLINLRFLETGENVFNLLFLPCGLILVASVLADKNSRQTEIVTFVVGMIIMAMTGLADGMVVGGDLPYFEPIAPWGLMGFLFSFQYVLGSKFARARAQKFELEKDLETAALLTTGFMPPPAYEDDRFSVQVLFKPARQIGGDWYTYTMVGDRWLHVHLGDVTGHSTAAALIAAFSKGATDMMYANISNDRRESVRLDQLHDNLNCILSKTSNLNPLMTFFSAVIDLHTGELHFINSGHTFPILVGSDGTTLVAGQRRGVLGVDDTNRIVNTDTLQLNGGESLLIYSDGFLDALHLNSARGIKKLKHQLHEYVVEQNGQIDKFVLMSVDQSVGKNEVADDITAISIRLKTKKFTGKRSKAA